MLEHGILAFATFFATIAPIDAAFLFVALTPRSTVAERRTMALKGVAIATCVLLVFAIGGRELLTLLGISLPALRTAGGILLFLMAVDMVFARHSGAVSTTEEEDAEAETKRDISVFPLATPLIAGPGAMGAAVLLYAQAAGDPVRLGAIFAALALVLLITLGLLVAATRVHDWLGITGINVVTRIMGILLAALAVQFIFDGIRESGLIALTR
jgi:multiple antibiotic resistance protein